MNSISTALQSSTVAPSATGTTRIGPQAGQTQMNQFLTMLTTELKNQDPTQPTDPTQFVAQLAQFSTVEQLSQSNATLTSMSGALGGMALGQYSNLINHDITAPSASVVVPATGSVSADMSFTVTNNAVAKPYVAVTDSSGNTVAALPVTAPSGTVTFDGTDMNGNPLPAGQYTVALVAAATGGTAGTTVPAGTLTTSGTVTNIVQGTGGTWDLQLSDGQLVPATTITSSD